MIYNHILVLLFMIILFLYSVSNNNVKGVANSDEPKASSVHYLLNTKQQADTIRD